MIPTVIRVGITFKKCQVIPTEVPLRENSLSQLDTKNLRNS